MIAGEPEQCALIAPRSAEDWAAYHDIRRRILFERRGQHGVYDANRPDERASGRFPRLLLHASAYVGVVRIDIEGEAAYLRRVAIDEPYQRQGFGRRLLALAEAFAREQRATRVASDVAQDAVPFYLKCGYRLATAHEARAPHPTLYKDLAPRPTG